MGLEMITIGHYPDKVFSIVLIFIYISTTNSFPIYTTFTYTTRILTTNTPSLQLKKNWRCQSLWDAFHPTTSCTSLSSSSFSRGNKRISDISSWSSLSSQSTSDDNLAEVISFNTASPIRWNSIPVTSSPTLRKTEDLQTFKSANAVSPLRWTTSSGGWTTYSSPKIVTVPQLNDDD